MDGPHPARVIVAPGVGYAGSGDLSIAYQGDGDGPVDLVLVPGMRGLRPARAEGSPGEWPLLALRLAA